MPVRFDPNNPRHQILTDAVDDNFGLYEFVWYRRGRYPEQTDEERVAVLRRALTELIVEGLVGLYVRTPSGGSAPVDRAAELAIVEETMNWRAPSESGQRAIYEVGATERGKEYYYALEPAE